MGKIVRSPDNLYVMPTGSFIRNKKYVYVNTSNKYVSPSQKRERGGRGYTDHDSICVGVLKIPDDPSIKLFYGNDTYRAMIGKLTKSDPPEFADGLSVGLHCWICKAAEEIGLDKILIDSFGEENAKLVLDCTAYMMSRESAVMQHYPAWARDHMLFSESIVDDTEIGKFLKGRLTISKIKLFKDKWAASNIGDGYVYLCYDSTNVNSQAEGVFIVQKGHAKDDPSLKQVNTDYVVRQSDGLPFTYLHSPGSVTDIAQAQEMIKFISRIKKLCNKDVVLCLICDRGYISEKNLKNMDKNGISYIMMLRSNFGLYDEMADKVIDTIKTYKNELQTDDDDEKYGITEKCTLYAGGPTCCAQIIWSADRYRANRSKVTTQLATERSEMEEFIKSSEGKVFTEEELKWVPKYFKLDMTPGEPKVVEKKKRGRGKGTTITEIPTFYINGFSDVEDEVNRLYQKAGIMIIVTRDEMTAQECMDAYAKRDCVEKTFMALKSHLGMDKIGVTTEEAMHGKGLIWFVASILHSVLFNETSTFRMKDRKRYTVPAMIDQLEAIKADKDLLTKKYERRYKLTRLQLNIMSKWKIDDGVIDEMVLQLD